MKLALHAQLIVVLAMANIVILILSARAGIAFIVFAEQQILFAEIIIATQIKKNVSHASKIVLQLCQAAVDMIEHASHAPVGHKVDRIDSRQHAAAEDGEDLDDARVMDRGRSLGFVVPSIKGRLDVSVFAAETDQELSV